ncbi:MAG: NAD(P)-dependent oxidoreductase, partial [Nitrososphaerota archaeon]|nr:NAD(P)-dependent oxidoreductase [Nitrososphaerota archaeon]
MNILITGGTGYIGAHLAYELATRGERVVAYDVSPAYKALEGVKDVKVVKGDILDLPRLLHTIKEEKVDMIVHTAAMLTDESEQRPSSAFKINVEGTINCLEATRLFNLKRIVYISSRSVYGYTPIGKKINEDHPKEPVSIYGITKLMGEYFGLNYVKKYGIDFIALRFPIVFGIPRAPMSFRGVSGAIMDIIQKSSIG